RAASGFAAPPEKPGSHVHSSVRQNCQQTERPLAARLVEFLSVAYCRVILEPTGCAFSGHISEVSKGRYNRGGFAVSLRTGLDCGSCSSSATAISAPYPHSD